jgi:hypothetical protein
MEMVEATTAVGTKLVYSYDYYDIMSDKNSRGISLPDQLALLVTYK